LGGALMAASSPFFTWFRGFIGNGLVRDLPRSELVVLLILCRHADRELKSWPSVARIVEMSGLGATTVYRALDDLHARGLVDWQEEPKLGGRGQTYMLRVYRLRLPEAQEAPTTHSHPREHVPIPHDKEVKREVLSTEVHNVTAHSEVLSTYAVGKAIRAEASGNGNGQGHETENIDGLRDEILQWFKANPGPESPELKALCCARWFQSRRRLVFSSNVLPILRELVASDG
jgi:hypothetical protein